MFNKMTFNYSPRKFFTTIKGIVIVVLVQLVILSYCVFGPVASAQSDYAFNMTAYKSFLTNHQNMDSDEMLLLHPAGSFKNTALTDYSTARYFQPIDSLFTLTQDEKKLLEQHSFVVTERIQPKTFATAFSQIYQTDMPLFVSTDAILHALHMSYDLILEEVERAIMIPKLKDALTQIHAKLSALDTRYAEKQGMKPSLSDVDLYLTVARRLLGQNVVPLYPSTYSASDDILQKIAALQWVEGASPLFADTIRLVDYSQFTVRGHYTHDEELSKYFQSMIWLGRTEFYLSPPKNTEEQYTLAQIQRQVIAALLLKEAVELSGVKSELDEIDDMLKFFVGDPDNVTIKQLNGLVDDIGLTGADEMLDTLKLKKFQRSLLENGWAYQRILSQMLCSDPFSPDQIQPASSFLLMGQRFVIDSYVTGSVVYDKIVYQDKKIKRMLPSTMDVLFALGNDASGQLLVPELDEYHYATNLAALRYLIDSYEPEFWNTTFYNGWLNAIRSLNPPEQRSSLPAFMQTAAWWQEKMNTQLASWAELRHDNLLYVKQSYTGIPACSYPFVYVEPNPGFYRQLALLADTAAAYFQHFSLPEIDEITKYFENMKLNSDTLITIAEKELLGSELEEDEKRFLSRTLYNEFCGSGHVLVAFGWYPEFYFGGPLLLSDDANIVVADVHTSPADEVGNMVGWVLHAGTGPLNLAFVITDVPKVGPVTFAGPVMSYHETVTTDFKRLTDEEWQEQYAGLTETRPSWVNLYLADTSGETLGEGQMLVTDIERNSYDKYLPTQAVLEQNYPNPFNPITTIMYSIPKQSYVTLKVYDLLGREVETLVNEEKTTGIYEVDFDGRNIASGVYFYQLRAGSFVENKKMILLK